MGHKRAAGKMEQRAPKTMSPSHMNKTTKNLALENIRISTSLTVVGGMCKNKAPGPDGFSMAFFRECWDIVKEEGMQISMISILFTSLRSH